MKAPNLPILAASLLTLCASLCASAQADRSELLACPAKTGGVYYAYPMTDADYRSTPAPKGFSPFYISHYGRHGSRYHIGDYHYNAPLRTLRRAAGEGKLTPLGLQVLASLETVAEEARGRDGELTELGRRQHAAIGRRMAENFPQVFADSARVTAASTQVMRCAHSMFAFIESLKKAFPELDIPRESSQRNMYYLCHWTQESADFNGNEGPWRPDYLTLKNQKTNPDRLMAAIFNDPDYVASFIVPDELMWQLYYLQTGQQNLDTRGVDFSGMLTPDELADLWEVGNADFYMHNADYARAGGLHTANAKNLLRHIVENADSCIARGSHGATLRFGHDGNITPLLALMHVNGCDGHTADPDSIKSVWNNFFVSPMAANLQLIFFRDKKGEVIVKILHNERETSIPIPTDIYPYYRWADVRDYYRKLL